MIGEGVERFSDNVEPLTRRPCGGQKMVRATWNPGGYKL